MYLCNLVADGRCPLEHGITEVIDCHHRNPHTWEDCCDVLIESGGCLDYTDTRPCDNPRCVEYEDSLAIRLAKAHRLRTLLYRPGDNPRGV
jgi:hypothetical protein